MSRKGACTRAAIERCDDCRTLDHLEYQYHGGQPTADKTLATDDNDWFSDALYGTLD